MSKKTLKKRKQMVGGFSKEQERQYNFLIKNKNEWDNYVYDTGKREFIDTRYKNVYKSAINEYKKTKNVYKSAIYNFTSTKNVNKYIQEIEMSHRKELIDAIIKQTACIFEVNDLKNKTNNKIYEFSDYNLNFDYSKVNFIIKDIVVDSPVNTIEEFKSNNFFFKKIDESSNEKNENNIYSDRLDNQLVETKILNDKEFFEKLINEKYYYAFFSDLNKRKQNFYRISNLFLNKQEKGKLNPNDADDKKKIENDDVRRKLLLYSVVKKFGCIFLMQDQINMNNNKIYDFKDFDLNFDYSNLDSFLKDTIIYDLQELHLCPKFWEEISKCLKSSKLPPDYDFIINQKIIDELKLNNYPDYNLMFFSNLKSAFKLSAIMNNPEYEKYLCFIILNKIGCIFFENPNLKPGGKKNIIFEFSDQVKKAMIKKDIEKSIYEVIENKNDETKNYTHLNNNYFIIKTYIKDLKIEIQNYVENTIKDSNNINAIFDDLKQDNYLIVFNCNGKKKYYKISDLLKDYSETTVFQKKQNIINAVFDKNACIFRVKNNNGTSDIEIYNFNTKIINIDFKNIFNITIPFTIETKEPDTVFLQKQYVELWETIQKLLSPSNKTNESNVIMENDLFEKIALNNPLFDKFQKNEFYFIYYSEINDIQKGNIKYYKISDLLSKDYTLLYILDKYGIPELNKSSNVNFTHDKSTFTNALIPKRYYYPKYLEKNAKDGSYYKEEQEVSEDKFNKKNDDGMFPCVDYESNTIELPNITLRIVNCNKTNLLYPPEPNDVIVRLQPCNILVTATDWFRDWIEKFQKEQNEQYKLS